MAMEMTFEAIKTAASVALALVGGLTVIITFVEKLKNWSKPAVEQNKSVHDKLAAHERMLSNDKARLDSMENGNKVIYKCLAAMLDHEITGNSIEKLKRAKDELNQYLIER